MKVLRQTKQTVDAYKAIGTVIDTAYAFDIARDAGGPLCRGSRSQRHPKPSSEFIRACDIPRLVRTFNVEVTRTEEENTALHDLILEHQALLSEVLPTLTSDEIHLIVDSGASITVTNNINDFIEPPRPVQDGFELKGIASNLKICGIGTVKYSFIDDQNRPFKVKLKDVLYVPDCPQRLLCPQQLAVCSPNPKTDGFFLGASGMVLVYGAFRKTLPYHPDSNLPILTTAPGFENFQAFCAEVNVAGEIPKEMHAFMATRTPSKKQRNDVPQAKPVHEGGSTDNLKPIQRDFLRRHQRLGHVGFEQMREWARHGVLPKRFATVEAPICKACCYGDAKRRAAQSGKKVDNRHDEAPGSGVSVDQMAAGCEGLLPTTKGRPTTRRYRHATLWIDHFSRFVYPYFQESTNTKETQEGKTALQRFAAKYNVRIDHIHADNGIFASADFIRHCVENQQTHSFCGVGAHWQNGIAERYIGVITSMARTFLLHAQSLWSDVITTELWPYCIRQAINFHNVCVRKGKTECPWELFTSEKPPFTMNDFRVWGCPVYVTDKRVQDGTHIGRWEQRARQCVYVGHSLDHGNNVYLVWDPATKHVSPQYHLVFDESFTTVASSPSHLERLTETFDDLFADRANHWQYEDEFFEDVRYLFQKDTWSKEEFLAKAGKDIPAGGKTPDPVSDGGPSHGRKRDRSGNERPSTYEGDTTEDSGDAQQGVFGGIQHAAAAYANALNSGVTATSTNTPPVAAGSTMDASEGTRSPEFRLQSEPGATTTGSTFHTSSSSSAAASVQHHPLGSSEGAYTAFLAETESARQDFQEYKRRCGIDENVSVESFDTKRYPPDKASTELGGQSDAERRREVIRAYPIYDNDVQTALYTELSESIAAFHSVAGDLIPDDLGAWNDMNPVAFAAAAAGNEDTLSQSQMKRAEDRASFEAAQIPEIQGLIDQDVWEYVSLSDVPPGYRLLNAIWSYKRKRRPDGSLLKHKARICVDGSKQQYGVDYWDTFAPVVAWSTVRLVLCLASILNFAGRQVDYIQAFPQAELEDPVYMRIPEGWEVKDDDGKPMERMAIKLKKNLYGTKTAARNWFQKLSKGLIDRGFRASKIDPCLFMRNDCILVLYTDDCLVFAPDQTIIDGVISDLKSDGFLLKDEGDVSAFLGVDIVRKSGPTGEIKMTQTGLIQQIVEDLGLIPSAESKRTHQSPPTLKFTPASQILHPDPDGQGRRESWNYRSLIGKLSFLAQMTRPDIAFAVHQCARFSVDPKLIHEKAVKHIGRYLLATMSDGISLQPTKRFSLDAYVDSDFAGVWHRRFAHLKDSHLSRSGYVVVFCGCPIYWKSKLQSEIALSTTEAELIALSQCLRELIPMRTILHELSRIIEFDLANSTIETPHLETYDLAKLPKLPPSEVFEDNAGCVVLATSDDQYRPRTKHISIKWMHFKDHVRRGLIKVVKVDTALNWADILTKPLSRVKFEGLRRMLMGW